MKKFGEIKLLNFLVLITTLLVAIGLLVISIMIIKQRFGSCTGLPPAIYATCEEGQWVNLDAN